MATKMFSVLMVLTFVIALVLPGSVTASDRGGAEETVQGTQAVEGAVDTAVENAKASNMAGDAFGEFQRRAADEQGGQGAVTVAGIDASAVPNLIKIGVLKAGTTGAPEIADTSSRSFLIDQDLVLDPVKHNELKDLVENNITPQNTVVIITEANKVEEVEAILGENGALSTTFSGIAVQISSLTPSAYEEYKNSIVFGEGFFNTRDIDTLQKLQGDYKVVIKIAEGLQ